MCACVLDSGSEERKNRMHFCATELQQQSSFCVCDCFSSALIAILLHTTYWRMSIIPFGFGKRPFRARNGIVIHLTQAAAVSIITTFFRCRRRRCLPVLFFSRLGGGSLVVAYLTRQYTKSKREFRYDCEQCAIFFVSDKKTKEKNNQKITSQF